MTVNRKTPANRASSLRRLALAEEFAAEGYTPENIAAMAGYRSREQALRAAREDGRTALAEALRLPTRLERQQHVIEDFEFLMTVGTPLPEAMRRVGFPKSRRAALHLITNWDGADRIRHWLHETEQEFQDRYNALRGAA